MWYCTMPLSPLHPMDLLGRMNAVLEAAKRVADRDQGPQDGVGGARVSEQGAIVPLALEYEHPYHLDMAQQAPQPTSQSQTTLSLPHLPSVHVSPQHLPRGAKLVPHMAGPAPARSRVSQRTTGRDASAPCTKLSKGTHRSSSASATHHSGAVTVQSMGPTSQSGVTIIRNGVATSRTNMTTRGSGEAGMKPRVSTVLPKSAREVSMAWCVMPFVLGHTWGNWATHGR